MNLLEDLYDADREGIQTIVSEAELSDLRSLHERVGVIQEAVEDEFDYRVRGGYNTASGDGEDRKYAEEHAESAYE